MILTEEQIAERAKIYSDDTVDTDWSDAARNLLRDGVERDYKAGWDDCTEHYRELIEAGMKWRELQKKVESLNDEVGNVWTSEKVEEIGEYVIELSNRK